MNDLDYFNLAPGVGQRTITYRFTLIDGKNRSIRGELHPIKGSSPSLSHDSTSTISRRHRRASSRSCTVMAR